MSQQGEGSFKQKVVRELRETFGADIDVLVTQERGRHGVADLVICLKGVSIRNELKITGESPTKLQQLRLDQHARAGGLSFSSTPATWPMHLAILKDRFGAKK